MNQGTDSRKINLVAIVAKPLIGNGAGFYATLRKSTERIVKLERAGAFVMRNIAYHVADVTQLTSRQAFRISSPYVTSR
jgi:hypothetical protein